MNVLSMLARLQATLDRSDLVSKMLLIPSRTLELSPLTAVNLVVGYSGSMKSQAALDLTLWIAHQTKIATSQQVTVQMVYVSEELVTVSPARFSRSSRGRTSVLAMPQQPSIRQEVLEKSRQFEQADRILWQARCLAEEWRGALKTHLRFGQVGEQLMEVACQEEASLLILGCESAQVPLVRQLANQGKALPFSVIGIPPMDELA
ncbi:MAG: universal stress protein [Alkalinema sp. CAN_BIN05]|nr:universal stress protein [Alkalinema sp. CAN_BIN05]